MMDDNYDNYFDNVRAFKKEVLQTQINKIELAFRLKGIKLRKKDMMQQLHHIENIENDVELKKLKKKMINLVNDLTFINKEEEIEQKITRIIDTRSEDYHRKLRKQRSLVKHTLKLKQFMVGDILDFVYFYKNMPLTFCGICIAIKKKSFVMPDLSLILRNIIGTTGVEIIFSYFYNKGYAMEFLDYKRKFYSFNKNKMYYIRDRYNRESRVL